MDFGNAPLFALVFVGAAVFVVPLLLYARDQAKAWDAVVAQVASRMKLTVTPGTWTRKSSCAGRVGRVGVTIEQHRVSTGKSSSQFTRIRVGGGLPAHLSIVAEGVWSSLVKAVGIGDVEVGDPLLDAAVVLRGEPQDRLLARFHPEARRKILRAVKEGARLENGEWVWQEAGYVLEPERLEGMARVLTSAAEALVDWPGDTDTALRARVADDPETGVRTNALRLLLEKGRVDAAWLRSLCDDDEPDVALLAARAAGEDGRRALIRLMDHADAEIRRAATLALAELPPGAGSDGLEARLLALLAVPDGDVVRALGRHGTTAAVEPLTRLAGAGMGIASLAREAREAIDTIQGRLVGAERGGLTLAAPAGGELAVAEPTTGAVSVAERARTAKVPQ